MIIFENHIKNYQVMNRLKRPNLWAILSYQLYKPYVSSNSLLTVEYFCSLKVAHQHTEFITYDGYK